MKNIAGVLTILVSLLLLVSCASSVAGWVTDPYSDYSKDLYICGLGFGETESQADTEAKAQLASMFGLSVSSDVKSSIQQQSFGNDKNLTEHFSQYFSSESSINYSVEKLYGVTIADRTVVDGKCVSLAVMEKRTTADYYLSRLEPTKQNIANAESHARENIGTMKGVRDASECIRLCDEYNSQVAICNYLSNTRLEYMGLAEASELNRQTVDAVVIGVEVNGDDSGVVKSAVSRVLTEFGFTVSNGTEVPSAKATVTVNWRESAGTGVASSFIFANYNADVSLVDIAGNETVMVFAASGKEGHQSYENAKGRATSSLASQIETEFRKVLNENFGY